MQTHRLRAQVRIPRSRQQRQGAACVEFAILAPILSVLVLSIIDVGQYVNVAQTICNASREGARFAARQTTLNVTQVHNTVANYLTNIYPGLQAAEVAVTITDEFDDAISDGDLTTIPAGSELNVQVALDFQTVRWISGITALDSRTLTTTTVTRRE